MNKTLLVDFGATHIKSVTYDVTTEQHSDFRKIEAPQNTSKVLGEFVVSQERLTEIFKDICESYRIHEYEAIFISSQMHGFVVADKNNNPLTDYISWQDHRGPIVELDEFRKITGMKSRIGLPIYNLYHMVNTQKAFGQKIKVMTLPDLLANISGKSENITHNSMLASTGLYDVNREQISPYISDLFQCDLMFNNGTPNIEIAGYYNDTPIYTGVGDLQSATYGAVNADFDSILVNIGTGSQVSRISETKKTPAGIEYRPYIGDNHLHTVTHIPAGRALRAYLNLFSELGFDCWEKMRHYTHEEIVNSTLEIDFAIFESALGYSDGGSIRGIRENNFNIDNILTSLIGSLTQQYVKYIDKFDCNNDLNWVILSGGIPRNIPALSTLMTTYAQKSCIVHCSAIDETLHGLSKIARNHAA
jgi:sugar (pentulose or hexulose) kinase